MTRKPTIAHISADFPDPFVDRKSPVVRTLLDLTRAHFTHHVVSLNRKPVAPLRFGLGLIKGAGVPQLEYDQRDFAGGVAMSYCAPPRGLMHVTMLRQLGAVIAQQLCNKERLPDLLIGHKLTVEGIAVAHAAAMLKRPYALTIQGNTDLKILRARPDLAPMYKRIFHGADQVVSFAPWSLAATEARLGSRTGPCAIIPAPTELDSVLHPKAGGAGLLTMFHLHGLKHKNLSGMVAALRILKRRGLKVPLAIVGGGSDAEFAAARAIVGDLETVTFEGELGRVEVAAKMNAASALILPSKNESFGLVFSEALFAGCPIIFPEGRAVDGYFDNCPFALSVNPSRPDQIALAIEHMINQEAEAKLSLRNWQDAGGPERFTRSSIGREYSRALMSAVGSENV